jgi:DNA-binding beta-propeller fold protein YncE
MNSLYRFGSTLVIAAGALLATSGGRGHAQMMADPNAAPNPYKMEADWPKLPAGRKMGAPIGVEVDHDGKSVWVFERCGANNCANSKLDPIMKLDPTGKLVANFGGGMFNFPHGLGVDRDGNVYVTDGRGLNGKGDVVVKFSPQGKVLLTLGKAGMPGNGEGYLNQPSDVAIAANGDIYVADGHGGTSNDRIVKFSKDGKFIKAWGKHGKAAGEFDTPHGIALDADGHVYVADRVNNRVQVFDADGKLLHEWKQFGRPSGVVIDKNGMIYVSDSQSDEKRNPGFKQGIRIGSIKDGKVVAFIPQVSAEVGTPESISVDDAGNIYAGFTNKMHLNRFVKK